MSVVTVTGGAGFIGRAVVDRLRKAGHQVAILDTNYGNDVLTDPIAACDAVIHLAGVLGTSELFERPELAVDVNVKGTLNVLRACRLHGARFVGITMPESGWTNVYAATKACAQTLARAWHQHYSIPVCHVRAFNAYGPGQKCGVPRKIIPTFAQAGWQGQPIEVWGDGTQTVDLIHVDDIARTLVDALGFGDDEVFDAGTGTAVTVNEVAEFVRAVTGGRSQIVHLPMRLGEDHHTRIVARGEGWDRLEWYPKFDWDRLGAVVREYQTVARAA